MSLSPLVASALISTAGGIASGLLGGDDGPGAREQINNNAKAQAVAFRKLTAQKMRSAKAHNIHPLVMLGAQAPQVSAPVYHHRENMGQNIAQAVAKGASSFFTAKANQEMSDLALERAKLENQLLRTQITSINNQSNPGSAYSNDQRVLNDRSFTEKSRRVYSEQSDPSTVAGANRQPIPASDRVMTQSGDIVRVLSENAKQLLEEDPEAYVRVVWADRWKPSFKKVISKQLWEDYIWLLRKIHKEHSGISKRITPRKVTQPRFKYGR